MKKAELLASPPGTGKTTVCIDLFREAVRRSSSGIDSSCYFVLPSREHADRIQNLILKKDIPGLFNAHVITINDLASRLAGTAAVARPSDAMRLSIVRGILERTHGEPELPVFGSVKGFEGFHELLVEALKEFKSALLGVREFEKLCQPLLSNPVFRAKFRAFTLLFKHYGTQLEELGLREPEDDIAALEVLETRGRAPELVIFDGFYHFTRAQSKLIMLTAKWAERTIVTLTLDAAHRAGEALFGYPARTRALLLNAGFRQRPPSRVNHRASHAALRHLVKHIFSPNPPKHEGQTPIAVFSAPSRRIETEMIAREVRRLYRETPIHFSDVCVILRSVSGQKALIESVFSEYGVPVTIHERYRLVESGLLSALRRFLRLITENWKREDVLYLSKSSYFRAILSFSEALALERAALRENVAEGPEAWKKLSGLPLRASAFLSFLSEAESGLLSSTGRRVFVSRIESFLTPLQTANGARLIDETALSALRSLLSAERLGHSGVEAASFDTARATRETLASVENGLFSMKQRERNRVQIYDSVMALPKEYKVVFVADLLEKSFPQAVLEDPLFKDAERKVMNAGGPVLEERGWRLSGERYFFYMAVARARERLYLTHSTHDSEGKPVLASFFIEETLRCFEKDSVTRIKKSLAQFLPSPEEWESETDVARGLAALGTGLPAGEAGDAVRRSGFRDPAVLKILSAGDHAYSASSLEAFLACPFRYFAEHELQLNRPFAGREYALMGTLLHETLHAYFESLTESDRASGKYFEDPARMEKELTAIFDRLFDEGRFGDQPLYRQKIWRESMRRMLLLYVKLEVGLSGTGTRPSYFEWSFGKGTAAPLRIPDPGGDIVMKGSVDRIDTDTSGKKAFIIDYKRSSRELAGKIKKGDEIQLPIYLLAARELLKLEPGGLEHRVLKSGKREDSKLEGEALENFLTETEARVRQAVRRIRSGDIGVEPKDCAFCEFDAVCRVEVKKGRKI